MCDPKYEIQNTDLGTHLSRYLDQETAKWPFQVLSQVAPATNSLTTQR